VKLPVLRSRVVGGRSDARYFWTQLGRWSSWTMAAHFDFAFPAMPVLAMQLEEPGAAFESRFLVGILEDRVAAVDSELPS
jgi:hypothetical protein